jgi:hypothetical protein
LETLRYRNDLEREENVLDQLDYRLMVRYKIYKCDDSYDILFDLSQCDNQPLREKAIELLKRLPTDPKIIDRMLSHVEFDVKDEFSVWYRLTLVQYLLNS